MLTLLIGFLHTMTGLLRYDLQLLFSLPVFIVPSYAGAGAGYGVAGMAVLLWFVAGGGGQP